MPIVQTYDTWGNNGNATFSYDTKTAATIEPAAPIAGRKKQVSLSILSSVSSFWKEEQICYLRLTCVKVSYHHNAEAENHHFGTTHPMKPWRLTLTNQLVLGYGLQQYMDNYCTRPAVEDELLEFHGSDYLEFLKRYIPFQYMTSSRLFSRI